MEDLDCVGTTGDSLSVTFTRGSPSVKYVIHWLLAGSLIQQNLGSRSRRERKLPSIHVNCHSLLREKGIVTILPNSSTVGSASVDLWLEFNLSFGAAR